MEKKNWCLLLLVLGTAFWGISFPVTKMSIGNISQSTFLFYRFFFASILIGLIFHKQLKNLNMNSVKAGIGLAIPLTFGIHFQTLGIIKHTSASQCAFVAGMCVVLIPILKIIFYKSIIELKIWFSAALALLGLGIISLTKNFSISIGDAYVLIGVLGFSYYLIRVEYFASENNIIQTLVPMFTTAAILMFILSLFDSSSNWFPANNNFWIGVAFCSLFSTAFMYSVSNITQKYISAEKVAIIYLFEPVFAAIASFFILSENLTWRLLIGGSLILTATLISEIKFSKLKKTKVN
ncbi:drug/metabolite transporter (DMT)-like permease [Chryseobacterium sp. PvR013]|uniref:DMT family transporter n=1 Tax=Chryseobacterium sp. PvR013 TaxID=2806595 RepID=UPI001AE419D6|nr:DMT family transporter [Chryseobacterium sp. PvR013]MBP1163257.1 drug/metabolite transporter (DMT)-like permease [Chryseobacterium sp. PvR013]